MFLFLTAGSLALAQDCLDYADYFPDPAPTGPRAFSTGLTQAVAVAGTSLCLGTDTGVQIFDVSNPLAPIWLSQAPVWAERMVAYGDMLYTARYSGGLQAIDISDPTAPVITDFHRNDMGTFDFLIYDHYLYIVPKLENWSFLFGITVYDLTDPAHPELVNEVEGGAGFSICMSGDTMFLANYDPYYSDISYLGTADLSDPANPIYNPGWFSFPGRTNDIAVYGDYLYAATDTYGLYVIDVSDAGDPTIVHVMPELIGSHSVVVVGQTAWVTVPGAPDTHDLVALSLANPARPGLLNEVTFVGDDLYQAESGGWLYIANDKVRPALVDISIPSSPVVRPWTGIAPGHGELNAAGIAVAGDLIYIGSDVGDPLRIIDVSDLSVMRRITRVPGELLGGDVAVQDTLLFQMMKTPSQPMNRWLDSYSIADPENPRFLGRGEIGDFSLNLATTKGAVYTTLNGLIHVMDVSDPANPQHVLALNPPGNGSGRDLLVNGNHLYAPLGSSGLVIYDITEAVAPLLVAVVDMPHCYAVDIRGNLAYATDHFNGLSIIDISEPAEPIILHSEPTPEIGHHVRVDQSKLFITTLFSGGWVYDLADPLAPRLEGEFFTVSGATEMEFIGPWMAMAQAGCGVQFAWRACESVVSVPEEMPPLRSGIFAMPNPFNPRTTITYSMMRAGDVEVSVVDVAGRRVAELVAGWQTDGTHTVAWDGRDAGGRAMPSGSYMVRVRSADSVQATKLTLVR